MKTIAKYKILASDGQEYDVESANQIKQWIADNRLDGKTPIYVEGAKDWAYLESVPEFAAALAAQKSPQPAAAVKQKNDGGLNVIIPYKNVRALTAYYLGIFAVIPLLGIFLGLAGLALGISGLRYRRAHAGAGGAVHAWIGIVAGGFFGLLWLAVLVLAIMVAVHNRH